MSKRENLARFMMKSGLLPISARMIARDMTVLAFHRVGTPSTEYTGDRSLFSINIKEFSRLFELCKRRFDFVSLGDAANALKQGASFGRPRLAVTFDDGYLDNYNEAAPILKSMDIPATFFICPGLVDDPHSRWWDTIASLPRNADILRSFGFATADQALQSIKTTAFQQAEPFLAALREYSRTNLKSHAEQMMNWDMVADLHHQGFEIGAHSLTHRVLSSLSANEQQHEIIESKHRLELHINSSIRSFAYPVGGPSHYHSDTIRLVEDAGFTAGVTYGLDPCWKRQSPRAHLNIPRLAAGGSANLIFGSIIGLWSYDQ